MQIKNKGITLVALVLTIVVMLILVTVTINILIKTNLIETAEKAGEKYKTLEEEETKDGIMEINGKKYNSIENFMEGKANIEPGKRAEEVSNYKDVTIPKGFTVSGIKEEQTVDGGLVIYDIPEGTTVDWTEIEKVDANDENSDICYTVQKNFNQFVWVPVKIPYVTKNELDEIISTSKGKITTEKEALQSLANSGKYPMAVELANGTDYRGVLYNFSTGTNKVDITVLEFSTTANYNDGKVLYCKEPAKLSSTSSSQVNQTEEPKLDLQTEYNNIVKSIKKQKGFWVARYELSYNNKGESKRGKTVASASDSETSSWYGLYNACKTAYQTGNKNEIQSSMIYGSQWDQIMLWMKDLKNKHDKSKYYILDSRNMGNYSSGKPQVSGYKNDYSVKQIFDLGGNFYDWTAEDAGSNSRSLRGYRYGYDATSYPVSRRNGDYPVNLPNGRSSRITLYVLQ